MYSGSLQKSLYTFVILFFLSNRAILIKHLSQNATHWTFIFVMKTQSITNRVLNSTKNNQILTKFANFIKVSLDHLSSFLIHLCRRMRINKNPFEYSVDIEYCMSFFEKLHLGF